MIYSLSAPVVDTIRYTAEIISVFLC